MSVMSKERGGLPAAVTQLKIQDAGRETPDPLPPGAVIYYHTHGRRQYYGSCKLHKDPYCRHLVKWEPGYVGRGAWPKNITPEQKKKFQLGKTLMREWDEKENDVSVSQRCRTCWPVKSSNGKPGGQPS